MTEDWITPPRPANDNLPAIHLPPVVALHGAAGAGKSTAAAYLVRRHGYTLVKFAAGLKAMLRLIGLTDEHIEGSLKEVPCKLLCGRTPRHAMQTLGTEWGRDHIGPDFWANVWFDTAADILDQGGRVVVDDCRFDNEAGAVRRHGGVVVKLVGRGGIAGGHESEAGLSWVDHVVANVGGLGALAGQLDFVLWQTGVRELRDCCPYVTAGVAAPARYVAGIPTESVQT